MNTHTEQNVDFCQIKISMTNLIFKIKQFYAYSMYYIFNDLLGIGVFSICLPKALTLYREY